MAFCNQLPELFRLATPEVKKEISILPKQEILTLLQQILIWGCNYIKYKL